MTLHKRVVASNGSDLGNARYWYARRGRRLRDEVPVVAELAEIRAALSGARGT